MADQNEILVGSIGWADLTIDNAEEVKEFYAKVVGWKPAPVSMGDYEDFSMLSPDGKIPHAGICHNRGANKGLPSQWLIYINVTDIKKSVSVCKELGGKVLFEPKQMGEFGKYSVIQDPAGAFCALFQPTK
ncbi:MAG: VOC family protein [Melioribacteraceae bacterium]|nr:VOC family protein [Melioribacteraceae bacterium]